MEGLQVVKGIVAVLGHEAFGKVLQAIHPLLVTAELGLRLCICDILDGLALRDPSYAFLVIIALHMTNIVNITSILANNSLKILNFVYLVTCTGSGYTFTRSKCSFFLRTW